jgi:hypothetical protein
MPVVVKVVLLQLAVRLMRILYRLSHCIDIRPSKLSILNKPKGIGGKVAQVHSHVAAYWEASYNRYGTNS